ncbi:putative uncharacterized protein NEXN-AS1 [Dipodomys merriami]|uniref:putative uncharacterized protein NEXN-AS1 n=1 Tax=Dipodomys merriami TaxID=94247 RepID=UPI0038559B4A
MEGWTGDIQQQVGGTVYARTDEKLISNSSRGQVQLFKKLLDTHVLKRWVTTRFLPPDDLQSTLNAVQPDGSAENLKTFSLSSSLGNVGRTRLASSPHCSATGHVCRTGGLLTRRFCPADDADGANASARPVLPGRGRAGVARGFPPAPPRGQRRFVLKRPGLLASLPGPEPPPPPPGRPLGPAPAGLPRCRRRRRILGLSPRPGSAGRHGPQGRCEASAAPAQVLPSAPAQVPATQAAGGGGSSATAGGEDH